MNFNNGFQILCKLILTSFLLTSCSQQSIVSKTERTPADDPYQRIICDDDSGQIKIRIRNLVMNIDNENKFNMSAALKNILLITDKSISEKLKQLKPVDLQDTKDASITLKVSGGWTGMRVSYNMLFLNEGSTVIAIRSCAFAPWQNTI